MSPNRPTMSPEELQEALKSELEQFERALRWLEQAMPSRFFEEVDPKSRILIARNLLSFSMQDCFSIVHLKNMALVLCLDAPDADLKILKHFGLHAIRHYRTFVSKEAPPLFRGNACLRVALVIYGEEGEPASEKDLSPRFARSLPQEKLKRALELFERAKTRDLCQYEMIRNEDWKETGKPSLELVLAWRNVPKYHFLYRLAATAHHHGLAIQKVAATYVNPYSTENVLILSLGLHGLNEKPAWEGTDVEDFLRELVLVKYFETEDVIDEQFVDVHLLTGNEAHLVRNLVAFSHQALVYADPHLYSFENVTEAICRHPELTVKLCQIFRTKFHPDRQDLHVYFEQREQFLQLIENLDTGQPINDLRRKNIFKQALGCIDFTMKTNFYVDNKSAFVFRLDPKYMDAVPYERKEKFPELPYGIFFCRGMHFIGFNIRFKDLARGGVRTVLPERFEQYLLERNSIFSEAYNLAFTQQKKNKDIPEGGAKTAILLEPMEVFAKEEAIYAQEMKSSGLDEASIEEKLKAYRRDHRLAFLYASQRSFIESFLTVINCDDAGVLKAKNVVDYWKRPEYIYLGPDENMHNVMIDWIARIAVEKSYRPGRSFMSSKPGAGINHKEYGVTSFGVNVYLEQTLLYLGIDPKKQPFSIKISGGPDGDVAGNQILNLQKYYPNTARLVALVDVSGTIYDPEGLDLNEMAQLFHKALPLRHYPPDKLHEGGFLLDLRTKRDQTSLAQQTLCWRKKGGQLIQDWLSGNEMNHLYRNNVHQTPVDVFVPGGGRPRTLNESNYASYLDAAGKPTSRAIVEGANLYLTPGARRALEKLGVLVLKDSSCNKGGVICSSFEVLGSLCLNEEEFLREKNDYVKEVLDIIGKACLSEARLMLSTYRETGGYLTDISEKVSEKINLFKYQLLDFFENIDLPTDPDHPLQRCLTLYCPPLIRQRYAKRIQALPDIHKKAIIACFLGARLVYTRGLDWSPHIVDILPTLAEDSHLFTE